MKSTLFFFAVLLAVIPHVHAQFGFVDVMRNGEEGTTGIDSPSHVTVSPDDRHVYVAGTGDNAIAVFARDIDTGALTFLEAKKNGENGVAGLAGVRATAISADGQYLYAVASGDHAISVFARNQDGTLAFKQVIRDGDASEVDGLAGAYALAISPDGDNIYVAASEDHAVSVFSTDKASGLLTFRQVIKDQGTYKLNTANSVAVSPDNRHVYVTGYLDDGISIFTRDTTRQGWLTHVGDVDNWADVLGFGNVRPTDIVISNNGNNVYVSGYGGSYSGNLTVFARDKATGSLEIEQKFADDTSDDQEFTQLKEFGRLTSLTLTPQSNFIFTTGNDSDAGDGDGPDFRILSFERTLSDGLLNPYTYKGIYNNNEGIEGLDQPKAITFSKDGRFFYVASHQQHAITVFSFLFPSITSVSPQSGYANSEVTIRGEQFGPMQNKSTVTFGDATASEIIQWSDTALVVSVPATAAAGQVDIAVTVNAYTDTSAQPFLVQETIVSIDDMSPRKAKTGDTVRISGGNFGTANDKIQVFFGENEAGTVTRISSDSITAVVPEMADGTVKVRVVVNEAPDTSSQDFVIDNTPPLPVFSPAHKAINVEENVAFTIGFQEAIRYIDNSELSHEDLQQIITLLQMPSTDIAFTATYNLADSSIVIVPEESLLENQIYQIKINDAAIEDEVGNVMADTLIRFATGNFTPLQIQAAKGVLLNQATEGDITIEVTKANFVSAARMYYRGICSTGDWKGPVALASNDQFGYSFKGIEDSIGIEYRYEFVDLFDSLYTDTSYVYKAFDTGMDIPVRAGQAQSDYQLVSFPLVLDDSAVSQVFDELGAYHKEKWRVFTVGENNELIEYDKLPPVAPGKAYLLIFKDEQISTINTGRGHTVEVHKEKPFVIPVHPGWNLIGNPYDFDVSWEDVSRDSENAAAELSTNLIVYAENWDATSAVLPRGGGGLVYVDADVDSIKIPVSAKLSTQSVSSHSYEKQKNASNWLVPLSLTQKNGTLKRTIAGFGMHTAAKALRDPYDLLTPPHTGQYLDINFYHPDAPYFTRDIVPPQASNVWEFQVETNSKAGPLTLAWDEADLPQNDQQILLFDRSENSVTDMRKFHAYSFDAQKTRQFSLYYGIETFVDAHLTPTAVSLQDCFPNPFSEKITIPFTIPPTDTACHVKIMIYDMAGRPIAPLKDEIMKPGFHAISWEGTHASGNKMHRGMYICDFRAEDGKQVYRKKQLILLSY